MAYFCYNSPPFKSLANRVLSSKTFFLDSHIWSAVVELSIVQPRSTYATSLRINFTLFSINLLNYRHDNQKGSLAALEELTIYLSITKGIQIPMQNGAWNLPQNLDWWFICDFWHRFDVETRKCVRTFSGHTSQITDLSFSNDGKWLMSSDMLGNFRVWDIPSARTLQVFCPRNFVIFSLSWCNV